MYMAVVPVSMALLIYAYRALPGAEATVAARAAQAGEPAN